MSRFDILFSTGVTVNVVARSLELDQFTGGGIRSAVFDHCETPYVRYIRWGDVVCVTECVLDYPD